MPIRIGVFAARLNDEGRRHLKGAERGGALHERAAVQSRAESLRCHEFSSDDRCFLIWKSRCDLAPSGAEVSGIGRGLVQAGHCILQPVSSAGPAAFSPGTRIAHREHVVGIALRRMRLADKHGAHQFVVSGAKFRRRPVASAISGGSLNPESARASFTASSVFSWLAISRQCLHRRIAEPVARGGRETGDLLHRSIEFRDMRHARLIPPPFHGPPSDPRAIGHGADAFKLEQGAADRHLLVQTELDELLEA